MTCLVCVSDSHLGYRHRFKVGRLEDYRRAFAEAVDNALALNPGIMVLGGDLLHHARPDPKSMRELLQALIKAANRTQVVVCIGNHEISGHLGTTYSPIFSDIHRNIHVLSTENPHISLKASGKSVGFHGFQFLRSRKLAEETLERISSETNENEFNILCLHQAVEKYLSPFEVSLRALREAAPKYNLVLLGHVHKFQPIREIFDVTPAFYIGSTERISFNEWKNENGFLAFKDWNFREPEFVKVNSSPMRQIREDVGRKTPGEINEHVRSLIEGNRDMKLLQINLDVELDGDLLDVKHDWTENFPGFTILDVNVAPKISERRITIEKMMIDDGMIREYFEKSNIGAETELRDLCIELFEDYGK